MQVAANRILARLGDQLLPRRRFEAAQWSGRSALTLIFDDGRQSDIDRIVPILDAARVKGVFAPTTELLGTKGYFDPADLRNLAGAGHEVASHLDRHIPLIDRVHEDAEIGLRRSRDVLEDIVGLTIESVVYPFGANNRSVRATAAQVYRIGFSAWPGTTCGRFNRFAVRRIALGSFMPPGRDTDDYFESAMTRAAEDGRWLVLMVHSDAATDAEQHDASLFRLLEFAAEIGWPVRTVAAVRGNIGG